MKTPGFFFKVVDAIEVCLPIIVLLLPTTSPAQLFHGRQLSSNLFSIAVSSEVLTVLESLPDVRHISKEYVMIVLHHFTSKILIIPGFTFFSPVSLDPSVLNVNIWDLQCTTIYVLHDGTNVSLRVADVLILLKS